MQKKWLIGAAAAFAMAAPAVAHADTTGYVGAGYNTIHDDDDSFKDSYLTLQGAMVADIAGDWHVQFDAADGDMNHDSHDDAQSAINVHVFNRNDTFAYGVFGGFESRTGSSFWNLGAEGQYFVGNLTLSAAAMHGDERNNGDYQTDSVDLQADYFIMPNLSVGGGLNYRNDEWDGQEGHTLQVNAEYQMANCPLSFGAMYWEGNYDYDSSGDHTTQSFGLFAKWNFGTTDLVSRSHTGASMIGGSTIMRDTIGQY